MNLSDLNLMNLMSQLMQRQMGLDPPLTRDLIVERELPVPMPDGVVLLADRWAPQGRRRLAPGRADTQPLRPGRDVQRVAWSGRWPSAGSR